MGWKTGSLLVMFGSPSTSGKTEASEDDSDQDFRKTPTESVHFYHFVATNSSNSSNANSNNNSSNCTYNDNDNSLSSQDKKEDEKEAKRKTLRRQAIIQKRRSKK